ncbi:MAG: FAD-dependent oxidoreductase [Myxococcales bacterium]|nr:FAD-dependent oxidoreductase [Myxococcales bacterium]
MAGDELLRRDERDVRHWDETVDVLVVGFGCAGACAAIEAAEAGARVLVVDRSGGPGGTSINSGGFLYLGGGTALQKALGYEDSPQNMFDYMMAACGPDPDEALIAPYCEESAAHFDWVVARGVPYKESFFPGAHEPFHSDDGLVFSGSEHAHPFNQIARPVPRGHAPRTIRDKGALLMNKLIAAALGAGIETAYQSRCDALVQARDGSVLGCVLTTLEGERCVRALRGVILTAGGFIWNDAMLARYAPQLLKCQAKVGTETDDGLGIRLGLAAGGEAIRMEAGDVSLPLFPPNELRRGIFVDRRGQRFLNEDVYFGRAGETILYHQDAHAYLVVDDSCFLRPEHFPIQVAGVGETVEELERELGMPEGMLQHTVAYYNEHAARGEDPLFHKDVKWLAPLATPPYGAIDLRAEAFVYPAFTLGGLRIDPHGRVLTNASEPIPGLYAAGRTTSGVAKHGYSSGMSLGDGSFFGRRAGRHAAAGRG